MGACLSNCCIDMMNIKNYFHTTYNVHKGATVQFTQLNNEESSRRLVSDKPTNVYENRLELFSIDADEAEELQPHIVTSKSEPFTVASYMKWLQKQEVQVIDQTDAEDSDPSGRLGETDTELCVTSSSVANRNNANQPTAASSHTQPKNHTTPISGNTIVNPLATATANRRPSSLANRMVSNSAKREIAPAAAASNSNGRSKSRSNDRADPIDVELEWDDDEIEFNTGSSSRGRNGGAGSTRNSGGGSLLGGPSSSSNTRNGMQYGKRNKTNAGAKESLLRSGSKPDMEWDDDS